MAFEFEGPEKKLEIILKPGSGSLRRWDRSVWDGIVKNANAQILSVTSSAECDAYLLSESSLFVWDDCCLMITCGTTTLVNAALDILSRLEPSDVKVVFYERKNEYFPRNQKSDFIEDCRRLNEKIPGRGIRLGASDEHHIDLFHSNEVLAPQGVDCTLEVLMYDLQGKAQEAFIQKDMNAEKLRELTSVNKILPGFQIDDYAFKPFGYSLNALKADKYYTIHVTPQAFSPYVSFETNVTQTGAVARALTAVLEVFRPRSFDVVFFDSKGRDEIIELPGYQKRTHSRYSVGDHWAMQFHHFSEPSAIERIPQIVKF